jgi:hypothetical protein
MAYGSPIDFVSIATDSIFKWMNTDLVLTASSTLMKRVDGCPILEYQALAHAVMMRIRAVVCNIHSRAPG